MFKRLTSVTVLVAFIATSVYMPHRVSAAPLLGLPEPGTMVSLSAAYAPAMIKGITLDPKNPFVFDFIIDTGDDTSVILSEAKDPNASKLKAESIKLIKYFLAALTIPEKDLWVNLSPYEKDRMLPQNLSQTEMGRDMLAQDYLLKQITASLIYPEKELGRAFWDKVYAKAQQMYGTAQIPVNTFNKVWIVADKADVFERGQTAFVMKAHLKVMLEEDYLALDKNKTIVIVSPKGEAISKGTTSTIASQIIRDIVIPELEKEVNEGKNFAPLRQMFHSMILASWFKLALKDAVMTQVYGNQNKVKTLSAPVIANTKGAKQSKSEVEQVYERYLQAYKKGVFNYIKEDSLLRSASGGEAISKGTTIPRKYFSGGAHIWQKDVLTRQTGPTAAMVASRGMVALYKVKALLNQARESLNKRAARNLDGTTLATVTYPRPGNNTTFVDAVGRAIRFSIGVNVEDVGRYLIFEPKAIGGQAVGVHNPRVEYFTARFNSAAGNRSEAMMTNDLENIKVWKIEYPDGKTLTLEAALGKLIKEYDVRGFDGYGDQAKFPQQMDSVLVRWLGRALGSVEFSSDVHGKKVRLKPGDTFLIAGDNGPSTDALMKQNLIEGLRDVGINVIDLGTTVSGELYSNVSRFGAQGGLYITRSHVEIGTNGFKPIINGITLYGDMLKAMKAPILAGEYHPAAVRGTINNSPAVRQQARQLYFDNLRRQFAPLKAMLDKTPMEVAINLGGGSGAQQEYVDLFREILGDHLKDVLRAESDPLTLNGGLPDPSRKDAVALGHPKANIVEYSQKNPQRVVLNFDLDIDRVGILWDGELYLGDRMFYPVLEYMLTMDAYRDKNKTFYFDPRMNMGFRQLVESFGGIAKVHPKGHSPVKASMDIMLLEIAQREGLTVEQFLKKYPGFKLAQSEYSLHLFTTNEKGEPGDDGIRFALFWIGVFTKIKGKHSQPNWSLADYIQDLLKKGLIPLAVQLPEQRTSMVEDVKKRFMTAIKDHVVDFFSSRSERFHFESAWRTFSGSDKPTTLIDVNGVYYLRTSIGEIYWGWSNTSPKDAFGVQATNSEDLRKLTEIMVALWVHTRRDLERQLGIENAQAKGRDLPVESDLVNLPGIEDTETKALRDVFGVATAAEVEATVLQKYPTLIDALQALDQAMIIIPSISRTDVKSEVVTVGIPEDDADTSGVLTAEMTAAQLVPNPTGGIDLDANKMGMNVSKEGDGVDITFDPAMVERMKRDGFDGFVPVIINITPVISILPLLGLAPRREEEEKLAGV